jgi:hypothetical protein
MYRMILAMLVGALLTAAAWGIGLAQTVPAPITAPTPAPMATPFSPPSSLPTTGPLAPPPIP